MLRLSAAGESQFSGHSAMAIASVLMAAGSVAQGQVPCSTPVWQPGFSVDGVDGAVTSVTTWDPDGPGPQSSRVVVTGKFDAAGSMVANGLAAFDPATNQWSDFGPDAPDLIEAFLPLPTGELLVMGSFITPQTQIHNLAKWDGEVWSGFGLNSADGILHCATSLPNGDLVIGGFFLNLNGMMVKHVARWDGEQWHAMGQGLGGGGFTTVHALATLPNGDVIAAGYFPYQGAHNIARWNGTTWSGIGAIVGDQVGALEVMPNGDLIAAGTFTSAGGVQAKNIARWNGTQWSAMGTGLINPVHYNSALRVLPSGKLLVAGSPVEFGNTPPKSLAMWDGRHGPSPAAGCRAKPCGAWRPCPRVSSLSRAIFTRQARHRA